MARSRRLRSIAGWAVTLGFVVAVAASGPAAGAGSSLPAWHGGVDLYRAGTFTTQKSWLWCTAAGVQIVDNIVDRRKDHSTAGQRRYFDWMRKHNRYALPVSAGVDPAGWTAGLRHFVDDRYRLVSSSTFDAALRSAVTNLRRTNLPVAITVSHGGHGWILTGFRATADPATTASFKVTSVRVVGPLYGLQSKNGYDMPPNTKLTPAQLKHYFTPWKYDPKPMIWDGRYVSIQPIAKPMPAAAGTPTASARPFAATATASQTTAPTEALGPPAASPAVAARATTTSSASEAVTAASPAPPGVDVGSSVTGSGSGPVGPLLALGGLVLVASLGALAARSRARR